MYDSNQVYQNVLPKLEELEIFRNRVLNRRAKFRALCIILGVLVVIGTIALMISTSVVSIIPGALCGVFVVFTYYILLDQEVKKFRFAYKNKVISEIARTLEPSLIYTPSHGVSETYFIRIGHYSKRIDRYETEDYFAGKLGDTSLSFAEIHAEYKKSDGDGETAWYTLFKGVMFSADFHKHFKTWVTIRPDKESGLFGWIGKKIQQFSSSHVSMEDPEFEENFKVNAGNDQEARYLLTPDMQQRLLKVKKHYGSGVIISLQHGCVYLTVPLGEDWFEGSLNESALSEGQVSRIASQIAHFLNLVEAMNLNTRIWTKE